MNGGYFLPRGRKYYRCWIKHQGKTVIINHSIHGEHLWSTDQCEAVLDMIALQKKNGTFDPSLWGKDSPLRFERAWDTWDNAVDVSESRHYARKWSLKKFIPYFGKKSLLEVTPSEIQEVYNILKGQYAPRTLANLMDAFEAVYHFHGVKLPKLPPPVRAPEKPILYYERHEQDEILEFIFPHHRPIMEFIVLTGCRPSEAARLQNDHVKETIFSFVNTKTGYENLLPITNEVRAIFNSQKLKHIKYVFCTIRGNQYSRHTLHQEWERANILANEKYGTKLLSIYHNRHSKVANELEAGAELTELSRLLGHRKVTTTQGFYGRLKVGRVKKFLKKADNG